MSDTGQTYKYHIDCVNEEGQECSGVCNKGTHICTISKLKPARKHEVTLAVCYEPEGSNVPPVCENSSPAVTDWTLPKGNSSNLCCFFVLVQAL